MLQKIIKIFSEVDSNTDFTFKVTAIVGFLASMVLYVCRLTFMQAENDFGIFFDILLSVSIALGLLLSGVLGLFVLCIYISKREVQRERHGSSLKAHIRDILLMTICVAIIGIYVTLVMITAEWLSVVWIKIMTLGLLLLVSVCVIAIIVINHKLGDIESIQTKDGRQFQVEEDSVCFIEGVRTGIVYRVDGYVVEYEDNKDNIFLFKEDIDLVTFENGESKKFA